MELSMRTCRVASLICLLLMACGDDEASSPANTPAEDATGQTDNGASDAEGSAAGDANTDAGPVETDGGQGGSDVSASDTTTDTGSAAVNECAGLAVVERTQAVTDACADDASSGGVMPQVGDVVCRDTVVDPATQGSVTFTLADGQFANPSPGRDEVVWRAWVPERGPEPGEAPALVIMLHGFSANLNSLAYQSEHLASHGFAVAALTFPNAGFTDPPAQDLKVLEVQALIDLALSPDGPFGGNINAGQIALAGHSLGGKIAFFTAASDPRVDLVIGMDPNNGGGPPCFIGDGCNDFPVAPNCVSGDVGVVGQIRAESLVFATEDATLTPDAHLRAIHFYRGAPAPSHLLHFANAGHADWIAANETRDFSLSVTTALLLRRFYGTSSVEAWLPGGAEVEARVGSLLDEVASR
jgi:pimeloyl-ACP methyl ester carboxylesterase